MADKRVFENQINWTTNQQSAQQAINTGKAVAGSFNDIADAAARLNLSAEQVRALNDQLGVTASQASVTTGLLSQQSKEAAASVGFMRDLAAIQQQEAQAAQQTLGTQQAITEELRKQGPLASRLSQAAGVRSTRETGSLADLRQDAFGGGGASAGVTAGARLQQAAQFGIALPGIGFQSPLVVGLRAASLAADKTGASFSDVAGAAGLLSIAGVALALVLQQASVSAKNAKQDIEAALGALDAYYSGAPNLTEQGRQERLDALKAEREFAQERLDIINNAITEGGVTQTTLFGVDIGVELPTFKGAFGDLLGITDDLFAQREDAQRQVKQLADEEALLNSQRATEIAATNDSTAAETELIEARRKSAEEARRAIAAAQVGLAQDFASAQTMTAGERQQEAAAINLQIAALEESIDRYYLSDDAIRQVNGQITELQNRLVALGDVTYSAADAAAALAAKQQQQADGADFFIGLQQTTAEERQNEVRALQAQIGAIQSYIAENRLSEMTIAGLTAQAKEMRAQIEALSSVQSTYGDQLANEERLKTALEDQSDAVNDSLKQLADAQADVRETAAKTAEAYQDLQATQSEHTRNLEELASDAGAREQKIRRQTADDLENIDKQSAKRIREQKENDNLNIEAAIARGDIAAAQGILAQQQLRVEQEKRTVDEQKQLQREQQDEQLQSAREQSEQLLANEQERYDKELAQREEAYGKALEAQRAANAALEAQEQAHAFTLKYWAGVVADARKAEAASAAQLARGAQSAADGVKNAAKDMQAAANAINSIRIQQPGFGTPAPRRGSGSNALSDIGRLSGYQASDRASQVALQSFYESYNNVALRSGQRLPTFDDGGINLSPGLFYSGVPEAHIPLDDSRARNLVDGGGDTLVFAIDARGSNMDEAQFKRLIREEVLPRIETAKTEVVLSLAEANERVKARHV